MFGRSGKKVIGCMSFALTDLLDAPGGKAVSGWYRLLDPNGGLKTVSSIGTLSLHPPLSGRFNSCPLRFAECAISTSQTLAAAGRVPRDISGGRPRASPPWAASHDSRSVAATAPSPAFIGTTVHGRDTTAVDPVKANPAPCGTEPRPDGHLAPRTSRGRARPVL